MVRSVKSFSSISSTSGFAALLQSFPLHPSLTATHFKPFLRQVHRFVPQTFLEDNLHLHRMTSKRCSGASSLFAIIGNSIPFIFLYNKGCFYVTCNCNLTKAKGRNVVCSSCLVTLSLTTVFSITFFFLHPHSTEFSTHVSNAFHILI